MCRGTNTGGKTGGVKEIRVSGKCAKGEGSFFTQGSHKTEGNSFIFQSLGSPVWYYYDTKNLTNLIMELTYVIHHLSSQTKVYFLL